jgi:hypothetical protein
MSPEVRSKRRRAGEQAAERESAQRFEEQAAKIGDFR